MVKENYSELNKRLIELILQEGRLTEADNDLLIEYLNAIRKIKNWHVPYDLISSKVYEMNRDNIASMSRDTIASSIREKFDYVLLHGLSNEEWLNKIKDDVIRDVNLALVQKEYIDGSVSDVEKRSKEMKNDIDNYIKEVQDIKKNIYTDFITILGIFTAIAFSAFGGLKLISGVLGNFKGSVSIKGLGMIFIVASIILLSTYLILLSLLTGVSKLLSFVRDEENREYHLSEGLTHVISYAIGILLVLGVILFMF